MAVAFLSSEEVVVGRYSSCIGLAAYLAATPAMASVQNAIDVAGQWSVATPESKNFSGAALGPDITIERAGEKITIEYSYNRKRTWTLDGVEYKTTVRAADAGSYTEIGSARIDKGRIVLVTGRDRGGRIAREERIVYRQDDKLIVDATGWLEGKVVHTSSHTYQKRK